MSTNNASYESTANEIIGKAINTVLFVDDRLLEPFADATTGMVDLSKGVYDSFLENNCTVDFYKYKDAKSWKASGIARLNGKDLVILDWQLQANPPQYNPALEIIKEAIKRQNLHFVYIYTETTNLFDIIYKINSYFFPFKPSVLEKIKSELSKIIEDEEGLDVEEIFSEEARREMREMLVYPKKAGEKFKALKGIIEKNSNAAIAKKIETFLTQTMRNEKFPNLICCYCGLGISINREIVADDEKTDKIEIRAFAEKHFMVINHAIILIDNKDAVTPNNLYEKFKDAIIHQSGNFLTLMGLEMRNLFKESSGFIGKDIDAIDELAFFHHQDQANPADAFYDFLRELWKNQASSFLYNKQSQPKIFDSLADYKQTHGIDKKMAIFLNNESEYLQHLGKLNYYYNILTVPRNNGDQIKFGDIFIVNKDGQASGMYAMCITAHCDCLYSKEKIHNMFYFVLGSKEHLNSALNSGDAGFSSYIINNIKVEAIKWKDKPITIYIKPEDNNIEKDIPIVVGPENYIIKYHCTLKENYAQRIANKAFIYPFHVGIFFADTKQLAKDELK